MSGGYLQIYQRKKNSTKLNVGGRRANRRNVATNEIEAASYAWLVDKSIIRGIDNPTRDDFAEMLSAHRFVPIFRAARLLKVCVNSPLTEKAEDILPQLRLLLDELQSRHLLNHEIKAEALYKRDTEALLCLAVDLFEASAQPNTTDLQEPIREWLESLGIFHPSGQPWFSENQGVYRNEDPLRNGELLRRIAQAFKPATYQRPPPPVTTIQQMKERNQKSIDMLIHEGIITRINAISSEDIVCGDRGRVLVFLDQLRVEFQKRSIGD